MKIFILFSIILILSLFGIVDSYAQSPQWIWAKSSSEITPQYGQRNGQSITTDKKGNICALGTHDIPTIFGNDTLYGASTFITKYDQSGNVIWAKNAGGPAFPHGIIASDNLDNLYVLGHDYYTGIVLAKFSSNGNRVENFSVSASTGFALDAASLALDVDGNIYISGFFSKPTIKLDTINLSTSGKSMFVAKYTPNGKVVWAQSFNTGSGKGIAPYSGPTQNLTVDSKGNLYMTGTFYGSSITFGTITLYDGNPDVNYSDMFITKFDPNGKVLWAKSSKSVMADHGVLISSDVNANIYLIGYFDSGITLGDTTLTHTDSLTLRMYIAKYDSEGNIFWAKATDAQGFDQCHSVTTDKSGNFYITGQLFTSPLSFGNVTLTQSKGTDIFIVKYDTEGNALWGKSVEGDGSDTGNGITLDNNGNIYIIGSFKSKDLAFGATTIVNEDPNSQDIFIAKLSNITAIEEVIKDKYQIKIYPNPTRSTFHISGIEGSNWNITIYSLTGEKIHESLLKDSQMIDLTGKAKGTYVYQLLKDGEILKTGKLVVE